MKTTTRTAAAATTTYRPVAATVPSSAAAVASRAAALKDKDRFESSGSASLRTKVTGGESSFAARFGAPALRPDRNSMLAEETSRAEKGLNAAAGAGGAVAGFAAFTGANPANFTLLTVGTLAGAGEFVALGAGVGAALAAGVGLGSAANAGFEALTGKTLGDKVYEWTEDDDAGTTPTGTEPADAAGAEAPTAGAAGESEGDAGGEADATSSDGSTDDGQSSEDEGQSTEASGSSDTSQSSEAGQSTESEQDNDGDGDSDADGSTPNPEGETSTGQTLHGATGGRMGSAPSKKAGKGDSCPADGDAAGTATGPTVVGKNGKGGCDVLVADRAALDNRTALRLKLALAPGGIRA